MNEHKYLLGMTPDELVAEVAALQLPKFTTKQILDWVYVKRVQSIDDMTNISLKNRAVLSNKFSVGRTPPINLQLSQDGTKKMLFAVGDNQFAEAVTIPENDRLTLCVSSQVGCKMRCDFCMTGKQGFNGNLTVNEILNQIYSVPESERLTNIVFMGMGEPLDNFDNVMKTIEIITAEYGLAWSPRRITLSTIGVMPQLKRFLDESNCHLAVSIHSPVSEQRLAMMPIERKYPAHAVIDLLKQYDWSKQRRLSFEYIMFAGVNDSLLYARELAKLLSGLDCRINLIRFHVIPESTLQPSSHETMMRFRDFLTSKGLFCTIRTSRGEDISAACGMLSTAKKAKV